MSSFKELLSKNKVVLVDFFAEWCGPCKAMALVLKEVKEELADQVAIIKIDVDKNQPLSSTYNVRGVPTLILFVDGQQKWRQSGVLSKQDIVSIIKQHSK